MLVDVVYFFWASLSRHFLAIFTSSISIVLFVSDYWTHHRQKLAPKSILTPFLYADKQTLENQCVTVSYKQPRRIARTTFRGVKGRDTPPRHCSRGTRRPRARPQQATVAPGEDGEPLTAPCCEVPPSRDEWPARVTDASLPKGRTVRDPPRRRRAWSTRAEARLTTTMVLSAGWRGGPALTRPQVARRGRR